MMRRQLYKTLFGMLFGVLALLVVGCGSPGDSSPNPSESTPVSVSFLDSGSKVTATFSTDGGNVKFLLNHQGESNFIVWLWSKDNGKEALLVNEIGNVENYETMEELTAGDYFFEVKADGDWSIKVEGDSVNPSPGTEIPEIPDSISLELFNSDGQKTRTISATDPGIIRVTVTTSSGEPAPNQFLTVTTTKGSFENSDGTAITNSDGVAEFILLAGDANGAGIINVTSGAASLDSPVAFQIGAPDNIKIGSFINDVFQEGILTSSVPAGQTLSLGGTAEITASLAILEQGVYVSYTKPVDITFTTGCSTAIVDKTATSQNGKAATTYCADGCTSGKDSITAEASIAGSKITAKVDIDLARPDSGSITFVSADPEHLALNGTANTELPSTSTVVFLVKDQAANPMHNVQVNFSLSTAVGGIGLLPQTAFTDSEGKVQVTVTSGDVPTSVRVMATVNDSQISTVSSNLVISTGLPDQNSFSLSAVKFNPEAWSIDGTAVEVTIRAADHFNNPVPDGTTVSFRTEGGSIDSTCSTENGACSVEWRSQNPRPLNGRVTILATALGEESFIDTTNSNGRYESSVDIFNPSTDDMPEAFLDVNENGTWDYDEDFLDYNQDGLYTDGNGMYNGTLCVEGCSNELIHVQQDMVMVMSSSSAVIKINPVAIDLSDRVHVLVQVADINGNSMPGETTVELTAPENAEIDGESSFEIPINVTGPSVFAFVLNPDGTSDSGTESLLRVKVTSPGETVTNGYAVCTTPY